MLVVISNIIKLEHMYFIKGYEFLFLSKKSDIFRNWLKITNRWEQLEFHIEHSVASSCRFSYFETNCKEFSRILLDI